eukprot:4746264-Heterocapsa_arctica.AAC.1
MECGEAALERSVLAVCDRRLADTSEEENMKHGPTLARAGKVREGGAPDGGGPEDDDREDDDQEADGGDRHAETVEMQA